MNQIGAYSKPGNIFKRILRVTRSRKEFCLIIGIYIDTLHVSRHMIDMLGRDCELTNAKTTGRNFNNIIITHDTSRSTSLSASCRGPRTLNDTPSRSRKSRCEVSPRLGDTNVSEGPRRNIYSVLKSSTTPAGGNKHLSAAEYDIPVKASHLRGELGTNSTLQHFPFSLIQIHRDTMMLRASADCRRGLKCYLRFCGSMATGVDARTAAEAQLCNSAIKFRVESIGAYDTYYDK